MGWLADVESRIKRKNQILFAQNDAFLADLAAFISEQNHRIMVRRALELADEVALLLRKRYPEEECPSAAVQISKDWAAGKVKMRVAQRAILDAHAVAKELVSHEDIALCHTIGQACGVVHANGHAMGFPIYELTAFIRRYGLPDCKAPIEVCKQHYIDRIHYWREHCDDEPRQWADFMLKDSEMQL